MAQVVCEHVEHDLQQQREVASSQNGNCVHSNKRKCVLLLKSLFCAYHYYNQGPSGRHIAVMLHTGQVIFLIGCILLPISYTLLRALPGVSVQQVLGLFILEVGIAMVVAGVVTSFMVQKRKAEGCSCSPLWSQETLVVLYSYFGGVACLTGLVTFVVYWLPSQELPSQIVVGSGITCLSGLLVLFMARVYGRSPCFRKRQVGHLQGLGTHAGSSRSPRVGIGMGVGMSDPFSCTHQRLQTISASPRLCRDMETGPVVVYNSSGVPPTQTFIPTLQSVTMPPRYDTLSPHGRGGLHEDDLPPGYMLVSPMSPPPPYSETCETPKDNDQGVPSFFRGESPPGYTPRIESFMVQGANTDNTDMSTSTQQPDCVVITNMSSSCQ